MLPNESDEQLELGTLFLKNWKDPLAIIPIVVEIRKSVV